MTKQEDFVIQEPYQIKGTYPANILPQALLLNISVHTFPEKKIGRADKKKRNSPVVQHLQSKRCTGIIAQHFPMLGKNHNTADELGNINTL